jgi:hypothetical protein
MRGYHIKHQECKKKCIQVTYLKDQFIWAHEDPYVMYISTAAHTSTSYSLTPFFIFIFMFFIYLHLLFLHFSVHFS